MAMSPKLHLCRGPPRAVADSGGARAIVHTRSSRLCCRRPNVGAGRWRPLSRTLRVRAEGDVSVAENGGVTAASSDSPDGLGGNPPPVDDIAIGASPLGESVGDEASDAAAATSQQVGEAEIEETPVGGGGAEAASSSNAAGVSEERTPRVHTNIRNIPYVAKERVEHPFAVGDIVVGKVKWCGSNGAKIDLVDYPYEGMCWARYMPVELQDDLPETELSSPPKVTLVKDSVREFKIQAIADDCKPGGKGPLLTARDVDQNLNNRRLSQILDVCKRDREVINAHMVGINSGGVRCTLVGIGAFLPRSHCIRDDDEYVEDAALHERYVGKVKGVALIGLDRLKEKVVVSETRALESNAMRAIQPGALVWGSVRRIEEWGVFVGIDNTQMSCLLHISNVSQATVNVIQDVFQLGDRVCGVVISMEENFSRISLSTADLEESAGDMLIDKEKVYANAPAAVEQIQKEIEAQRAQYLQQQEQDQY